MGVADRTTQDAYMHQAALAWVVLPKLLIRGLLPTGLTGHFAARYIKSGLDINCLYKDICETKFNEGCSGQIDKTHDWGIENKCLFLRKRAKHFAKHGVDSMSTLEKILEVIAGLLGALIGLISFKDITNAEKAADLLSKLIKVLSSNNQLAAAFAVVLLALLLIRIIQGFYRKYLNLYTEALDLLIESLSQSA